MPEQMASCCQRQGSAGYDSRSAPQELVERVHALNLLAMNGIGTSQEGASLTTIEHLALMSKMSGADVHHIGDAGMMGMAVPEKWSARRPR